MTPIDRYLADLADQAGVTIAYVPLRHGIDGEYVHARRLIRLRPGMTARRHRSVLAHELGHAAHEDRPSKFGPVHAKQERRAEEWAALRLISLDDYRHVEEMRDGHPGAMACDLGVLTSIVLVYRGMLERLGDTVYVGSRMGAGQWAHREDVA